LGCIVAHCDAACHYAGANAAARADRVRACAPEPWTPERLKDSRLEETTVKRVDRAAWRQQTLAHEELFLKLSGHLPKELIFERELLVCRL